MYFSVYLGRIYYFCIPVLLLLLLHHLILLLLILIQNYGILLSTGTAVKMIHGYKIFLPIRSYHPVQHPQHPFSSSTSAS